MDWQQLISLCIVAGAVVFLAREEVRRRRRAKLTGCEGDCGCSSSRIEKLAPASHVKETAQEYKACPSTFGEE
jgi:hypothetical protein